MTTIKRLIALTTTMLLIINCSACANRKENESKETNSNVVEATVSATENTDIELVPEIVPNENVSVSTEIENTPDVVGTENEKPETNKTEITKIEQKPVIDNREKVTMIDLNTIYLDNVNYYTNIPSIEEYIAKNTTPKKEMPEKFKEAETLLLNALNNGDKEFTYTFSDFPSDFSNIFEVNYLTYGNCKSTLFVSCARQKDGSYLFVANLEITRQSMEENKLKWNDLIEKQKRNIAEKITHNQEMDKLNTLNKERVNQAVINAGVIKGMTVEDAIIKIDAYIRKINTYDNTYTHYNFTDVFDYGNSVCNGYAALFFLMTQRCGIDCEMVSSQKMNHIWNVVHIDGKTLYVDVTYNDVGYDYVLVDKNIISKTHTFSDTVIKDELHIVYV